MNLLELILKTMKKILKITLSLIFLLSFYFSNAQDSSNFYVGDWNVVAEGTPVGDVKMEMHLEYIDGKLTGTIKNEGIDAVKINKVEEKESTITIYYNAGGYDLFLSFKKIDSNTLEGKYLNMFDAKAKRITEK